MTANLQLNLIATISAITAVTKTCNAAMEWNSRQKIDKEV